MIDINAIVEKFDAKVIAEKVTIKHNQARASFHLTKTTVNDSEEFLAIIKQYYKHHFQRCVINGGELDDNQAAQRVKMILEREYERSQQGGLKLAYKNSLYGINGGLSNVIDTIAGSLSQEAQTDYINEVLDNEVCPLEYEPKRKFIRQFFHRNRSILDQSVDTSNPDEYVHNYRQIVYAYINAVQGFSTQLVKLH